MSNFESRATSPELDVLDVVDNPVFTDVTEEGETYTTYRIVRFVYEFSGHPQKWTHLAVVIANRTDTESEAFLLVIDRVVDESYILPIDA